MSDYTPEEKRAALELAIQVIDDHKLEYYRRNESYLSTLGKQRFKEYKQSIAILEQMRDEVKDDQK